MAGVRSESSASSAGDGSSESAAHVSLEMADSASGLDSCLRRGWMRKSHRGSPFAARNERRYLVSDGFHVSYYSDEATRHRTGRFDLRNVLSLQRPSDPDCTHGVEILLSETREIPPVLTKTVRISFAEESDLLGWLSLWASAVDVKHVSEDLMQHRDFELARKFNARMWRQPPLRSSRRVRPSPLLSPRDAKEAQRSSTAQEEASRCSCTASLHTPSRGSQQSAAASDPPRGSVGSSRREADAAPAPALEGPTSVEISQSGRPVFELSLADGAASKPQAPPVPQREPTINKIHDAVDRADPLDFADQVLRTESDRDAAILDFQREHERETSGLGDLTPTPRRGSLESRLPGLMASTRQASPR